MKFNYETLTPMRKALYAYAKEADGAIVEIGTLRGNTAIVLAAGTRAGNKQKVYAIDPCTFPSSPVDRLWRNIEQADMQDWIFPIRARSQDVRLRVEIALLFIDGDHSYAGVKRDLEWIKLVKPGGIIAFHDYNDNKKYGVKKAVDEYLAGGAGVKKIEQIKEQSLLVLKKNNDG
jgi:predicted O-methyltransferase YrrM